MVFFVNTGAWMVLLCIQQICLLTMVRFWISSGKHAVATIVSGFVSRVSD